jgi:hypothetical protein
MNDKTKLKACFPAFGGKSKPAPYIWERFGEVDNFIEPFANSLAVLLANPSRPSKETVSDINGYIVNFWRAVSKDPEAVAVHADHPVHEMDLHARHRWLVFSPEAVESLERVKADPEYFCPKIAGWWCWGLCCWIGSGWCETKSAVQRPMLEPGQGILSGQEANRLSQQVPNMDPGRGQTSAGVHPLTSGRPQLTDQFSIGRGVNGGGLSTQVPKLSSIDGVNGEAGEAGEAHPWPLYAGLTQARRKFVTDWLVALGDRLRLVRTCCGHWSRICDSDSTLTRLGTTAVFLDPPYPTHRPDGTVSRDGGLYGSADEDRDELDLLRDEVLAWCRKWGPTKGIRIAVCGYDGDGYEALVADGWDEWAWRANGGYANRKGGNVNAGRERIWFSPFCLKPETAAGLFAGFEGDDR